MAITILDQPTTPNVTQTRLVYSITGSSVNQPQYQYVTDIYESGSSTLLTRLFTYPNPQGSGIIEVSKILDDNLDYDKYWKTTGSIAPQESVKTFDIRFGEAYGTSNTSAVTIYTGSTPNYIKVFPGTVDPNGGSYNFNTSSFTGQGNAYLTNCPAATFSTTGVNNNDYAYLLNSTDYFTLTIFQDLLVNPALVTVFGGYLSSGSLTNVTSSNFTLPSPSGSFDTIGIGPKNLADWDAGWANYFASGSINVLRTGNDPGGVLIYINDLWDGVKTNNATYKANQFIPQRKCSDEYTRFAFINNYGFWDYYNVYNPTRKQTQVTRDSFISPQVDYSSGTSIYDITRRGEKQYNIEFNDTYSITTEYVDKNVSDWLTEMFDSPEVYIQEGSNFVPITITNATYDWNMSENRTKLFQYTIEYRYANRRYNR